MNNNIFISNVQKCKNKKKPEFYTKGYMSSCFYNKNISFANKTNYFLDRIYNIKKLFENIYNGIWM